MSSILPASGRRFNRVKTLELISDICHNPDQGNTIYSSPCISEQKLEARLALENETKAFPESLPERIVRQGKGFALFEKHTAAGNNYTLVIPPAPMPEDYHAGHLCPDGLVKLLTRDFLTAVVLVRLGRYAVAVAHGEKLVTSKVGSGLVHGRHRQGGSSANRFARHREKQIETFFTRICIHAREHIEPYAGKLDYIIYGGARTTILDLKKQCAFLGSLKQTELPSILDIAEPKQKELTEFVKRMWSCEVYQWVKEPGSSTR